MDLQPFCPNLRNYANTICDVDLDQAKHRRTGGLSGTNVRNQYYYEAMRVGPHSVVGSNRSAPPYIIAGCEAAFPWGKPGPYEDQKAMPDAHAGAYGTAHGLGGVHLQQIMDLIVANVEVPKDHPSTVADGGGA